MVQGAVYDAVNAIDGRPRPYLPSHPPAPPTRRTPRQQQRPSASSSVCSPPSKPTLALYDASLAAVPESRAAQAGRDRGRQGGRRGDAGPPELTTAASARSRVIGHDARGLAAHAAAVRARIRPRGSATSDRSSSRRRAAAHRRSQPARKPRVREGLQRDQVLGALTAPPAPRIETDGRDLLAGPRVRALEPGVPHACRPAATSTSPTARASSRWPTWRPPTQRSAAGTTSTTGTPGARSPRSGRPRRREPGDRGRPGVDTAVRSRDAGRQPARAGHAAVPRAPLRPQLRRRRDRAHVAVLLRHRPARDQSHQQQVRDHPELRRLSDVLKEIIDARVWAGIHFRTADIQGAELGRKVARYVHRHEFQPVR